MKIHVDYQLSEYLDTLYEAIPIIAVQRKSGELPSIKPKCGLYTKFLIKTIGRISFYFKKKQVGDCTFSISECSISRKSKDGVSEFEFSEIDYILALSNTYLVNVGEGAMPIPYRCFDQAQKKSFEEMYKEKIHHYET